MILITWLVLTTDILTDKAKIHIKNFGEVKSNKKK